MRRSLQCLAIGVLLCTPALAQLKTVDMNTLDNDDVAQLLAGPGITITNLTLKGEKKGAGSFTGGSVAGLGVEAGLVMSSGDIADIAGPNDSEGTSGTLNSSGDADLDALITPNKTQDATILEFDFITESENFGIKYVFASEEYKEYVGSQFNDVFAFFLDGKNIALIPNTNSPVSINNVNHESNTAWYVDNPMEEKAFDVEFDGFTKVLVAVATVNPGQTYHIKLAVADASDSILDSAVFLAQGGITGTTPATLTVDPKEIFIGNSGSVEVNVEGFFMPKKGTFTLAASGLPDGEFTFSQPSINIESTRATMRVTSGAGTLPNDYIVYIQAVDQERGIELVTTLAVKMDCAAPFIFGLPENQPASQSIAAGERATLRVVPSGSGPFRYQWYLGATGSTHFPIDNATSAQLTTFPIFTPTTYWVRVSNACGSIDSDSARITPQ